MMEAPAAVLGARGPAPAPAPGAAVDDWDAAAPPLWAVAEAAARVDAVRAGWAAPSPRERHWLATVAAKKELAAERRAKRLAVTPVATQTGVASRRRGTQASLRPPTRSCVTQTPKITKAHWVGAPLGVWLPEHDRADEPDRDWPSRTCADGPRKAGRVPIRRPGLRTKEAGVQTAAPDAVAAALDAATVARYQAALRHRKPGRDASTQVTTRPGAPPPTPVASSSELSSRRTPTSIVAARLQAARLRAARPAPDRGPEVTRAWRTPTPTARPRSAPSKRRPS